MSDARVAVYLGTFDPLTIGHLDIIERSHKLFKTLIIGVGKQERKHLYFDSNERADIVKTACARYKNVDVKRFQGLAVNFVKSQGDSVIIRGLRTEADFEYEMQMANMNHILSADIETVFIPTRQMYCHISSTLVKEVAQLGGDVSQMVPEIVLHKLKKKLILQK